MDLDDIIVDGKRFIPIADAAEIICGIYHNSNNSRKRINEWACKGYLNSTVIKENRRLYVSNDWVHEFAKTKKYKIEEAAIILGICKDTIYRRAKFSDERKIRLEKFPSGTNYITGDEIERLAELSGVPKGIPGTDRPYTKYEKWKILNRR